MGLDGEIAVARCASSLNAVRSRLCMALMVRCDVAVQTPGGVFMDQFECVANFNAHYHGTGPEVRPHGLCMQNLVNRCAEAATKGTWPADYIRTGVVHEIMVWGPCGNG
jgi:hypothetical protein